MQTLPKEETSTAKPKKSVRRFPWLLVITILLIAGTAGGSVYFWQQSQRAARREAFKSETAEVVSQDITIKVSAAGVLKPPAAVNISPKQPGRLAALYVDQGSQVKAGQLLARMDATNLQGPLLEAQGSLASAKANLSKLQAGNRPQEIQQAAENLNQAQADLISARSTYESNRQLQASGAISQNALDVSRSQYENVQARIASLKQQLNLVQAGSRKEDIAVARAQVTQAEGSLKNIQTQVDDTEIRAPFTGIVTQKYANPGAFVTPTTSASTTTSATSSSILAIAGDLEAVANVSESDIRGIYVGQGAELRVDAYPGKVFHGKVRLVAPEAVVTQNVTSFEVRVRILDDTKHQLKSGMNLTANFLIGTHRDALVIPTTAIVSEAQGTGVYVLVRGSGPVFRPIRVGATVGTESEVLSGLQEGERIFTTQPGQRRPNGRPVSNNASPFSGGGGRGGRPPR